MASSYYPKIAGGESLGLYLDAGNTLSYPGSGTTWLNLVNKADLNGNNVVGTLTGSPTFSYSNVGSIVLNGSSQYIDCGNTNLNIASGTTSVTLSCWAKFSKFGNPDGLISRVGSTLPYGGWQLNIDGSGNPDMAANISGTWRVYSGLGGTLRAMTLSTWYNIVGSYDGSNFRIYLNGSLVGAAAQSGTISYAASMSNLLIGKNGGGASYFGGNIAIAMVHNKTLSSSEVLQNFNAHRGRFGV